MQSRKKLINLFAGNISNSIIHKILEKAIDNKEIANKYMKELNTSLKIAMRYRERINPISAALLGKDIAYIRNRIISKVRAELILRISKGYENINLNLIEKFVEKALKDMGII